MLGRWRRDLVGGQSPLDGVGGDGGGRQGGEGDDSRESPLQDTQVGGGLGGERAKGVGRERLGLLAGERAEKDEAGGGNGGAGRGGGGPLAAVAGGGDPGREGGRGGGRRVARSGGSTGTVRPHSKRSRRRSTRPERSAGTRSAVRTSCAPPS